MSKYVFYRATGEVCGLCEVANRSDAEATAESNGFFFAPVSDAPSDVSCFYWDGRQLAPRRDYALDALPLPCTVWIEGQEYRCHEQPEFVFDAPGTYEIRVDAGPQYLEKVFQYDYQP